MRIAIAIALATAGGCGHGGHSDEGSGSNAQASGAPKPGADASLATAPWHLVGIQGAYAIVTQDDHRVAVVAADGHTVATTSVADVAVFDTSVVVKNTLIWADANGLHAWELGSGKAERWHADAPGVTWLVAGTDQVAALHAHGTDVFKIDDGARVYHREGPSGSDGKARDGVFVLSDAKGGIEAVAESSGKPVWKASLEGEPKGATVALEPNRALVFDGGRVRRPKHEATFENGSFVELDLATGRVLAKGGIDDKLPGEFAPGSQTPVAYAADGGTFVQAKPPTAPLKLFRRDPVGRIMWSATGWPLSDTLYHESASPMHVGDGVAAIVLKPRETGGAVPHILVVFDPATGKVHFKQAMGEHGELLKLAGGCAIALDRDADKLLCMDDATGKLRWSRTLSGRDPQAWGVKDAPDAMIVDGTPATLSRIDPTNKVAWQLELPDGAKIAPHDIDATLVVLELGTQLDVIDLGTGKLSVVHP